MIILKILLFIIVFLLCWLALMLFLPFRIYIKGTYWNNLPTGQMDVYWIKYILGARFKIRDMEKLHILVWFFGIPIPLTLPLKKEPVSEEKKNEKEEEKPEDPIRIEDRDTSEEKDEKPKNLQEKVRDILDLKEKIGDVWGKYKAYIQKIYVSYITFSLDYIDAELGLKDPATTGMTAGIVYSALSLKPIDAIHIHWNYQNPGFNISAGLKMTMNLFGILCTLVSLYYRYKKDNKNEVQ